MNDLPKFYFTMQATLFPMLEEEIGKLTAKMQEFLRIIELVRPSRFIKGIMRWRGSGRPMKDREKMLRAFFLKAVYDFPTTKVLIENIKTNPSLRSLCGWEYRSQVPSEATFSRAFKTFAEAKILEQIHKQLVCEQYKDKIVGHASIDSTAISSREKLPVRPPSPPKVKKKVGRKSNAEKAALASSGMTAIRTKRLELQPDRSSVENLIDLPKEFSSGAKQNSKGKMEFWFGYKLHLSMGDGGVPLAAILSSASLHDSQAAIPLMQMASSRARIFYDLADSAYDAEEIKKFSRSLGHVPIIDMNKRHLEFLPLAPAEKARFNERSTIERGNSDLKDNYGARHIRVKGHLKVFCHLMFGIIAVTVKQLFNMLE